MLTPYYSNLTHGLLGAKNAQVPKLAFFHVIFTGENEPRETYEAFNALKDEFVEDFRALGVEVGTSWVRLLGYLPTLSRIFMSYYPRNMSFNVTLSRDRKC